MEGVTSCETMAETRSSLAWRGPSRDSDRFEEFVRATGDRLYRTALGLCGNHHLAEELTQSTYAKVYASWSRVSSADSPIAYTRTVMLRTFISQRRSRRIAEHPVADLPEAPADAPDVTARLGLLAAMRHLSPPDRTVLVLRYWEDLSVTETAELLGIRQSTCRTRTTRALRRLRDLMPDLDITDDSRDPR